MVLVTCGIFGYIYVYEYIYINYNWWRNVGKLQQNALMYIRKLMRYNFDITHFFFFIFIQCFHCVCFTSSICVTCLHCFWLMYFCY